MHMTAPKECPVPHGYAKRPALMSTQTKEEHSESESKYFGFRKPARPRNRLTDSKLACHLNKAVRASGPEKHLNMPRVFARLQRASEAAELPLP